jgi:hypothetical protein
MPSLVYEVQFSAHELPWNVVGPRNRYSAHVLQRTFSSLRNAKVSRSTEYLYLYITRVVHRPSGTSSSVRHAVKAKCRSMFYSNPVDHETVRNSRGCPMMRLCSSICCLLSIRLKLPNSLEFPCVQMLS